MLLATNEKVLEDLYATSYFKSVISDDPTIDIKSLGKPMFLPCMYVGMIICYKLKTDLASRRHRLCQYI